MTLQRSSDDRLQHHYPPKIDEISIQPLQTPQNRNTSAFPEVHLLAAQSRQWGQDVWRVVVSIRQPHLLSSFFSEKDFSIFLSGTWQPCFTQLFLSILFEINMWSLCHLYKQRIGEAVYAWSAQKILFFASEDLLPMYAFHAFLSICTRLIVVLCSLCCIFQKLQLSRLVLFRNRVYKLQ